MIVRFSWDRQKDLSNRAKHRISFDEAASVFFDDHARLIADPDHSTNEDRFVLLGLSYAMRLLIVVHVYQDNDEIIRIISARKATKSESQNYETGDT
jgi:uncharacterized DUF497 family protein